EQAQDTAKALEGVELRFDRKAGPTGSLFGSVTATDLVEELWNSKRIRVDRKKIDLHDPIKRIGRYDGPIELFTNVPVAIRVPAVREGGELPPEDEPQEEQDVAEPAAEQDPEPETAPPAAEAPPADAAPP